ncbi:MAG: hypothetical protein FJ358_06475 [Thaumarchaeota archaeon]|nr:hypothetical protein [Nitrososphaerota archaeon]
MSQKVYNAILLVFIVVGAVLVYNHYLESYYSIDSAKAFLSRAETAPTPDLMADALQKSRVLIPQSGNPVWWFPTTRTDFGLIQNDMTGLIDLARAIGGLSREQEAYQIGMDTLRGKIRTLGEQLGEAAGYHFLNLASIFFGMLWVLGFAAVLYLRSKQQVPIKKEEILTT